MGSGSTPFRISCSQRSREWTPTTVTRWCLCAGNDELPTDRRALWNDRKPVRGTLKAGVPGPARSELSWGGVSGVPSAFAKRSQDSSRHLAEKGSRDGSARSHTRRDLTPGFSVFLLQYGSVHIFPVCSAVSLRCYPRSHALPGSECLSCKLCVLRPTAVNDIIQIETSSRFSLKNAPI